MLQFYFLSVLCNALTGIVLIFALEKTESTSNTADETNEIYTPFYINSNMRLMLGLVTLITGLLKLFLVINERPLILGDFFPAVVGLIGGFALLFHFFVNTTVLDTNVNDTVKKILVDGKKYIGVVCCIAALLHFLFPGFFLI